MDQFEKDHLGSSFDRNFDFFKKKLSNLVAKVDPEYRQTKFALKFVLSGQMKDKDL